MEFWPSGGLSSQRLFPSQFFGLAIHENPIPHVAGISTASVVLMTTSSLGSIVSLKFDFSSSFCISKPVLQPRTCDSSLVKLMTLLVKENTEERTVSK